MERQKWGEVELLIFDLDYTLIDSSEGIVYCFNQARRLLGESEVPAEAIKPRIGLPIEETFRLHGSKNPAVSRDLFRKLAVAGAMAERTFLLAGVQETIPQLKARGYTLAVASTKSRAEIQAILEKFSLSPCFTEICGSDQVAKPKPAPDPLRWVMEKLGVPSGKTVYVGDHVVDIQAARAAGTKIIIVTDGNGPCPRGEVEKAGPDLLISGVADLLSFFP